MAYTIKQQEALEWFDKVNSWDDGWFTNARPGFYSLIEGTDTDKESYWELNVFLEECRFEEPQHVAELAFLIRRGYWIAQGLDEECASIVTFLATQENIR